MVDRVRRSALKTRLTCYVTPLEPRAPELVSVVAILATGDLASNASVLPALSKEFVLD